MAVVFPASKTAEKFFKMRYFLLEGYENDTFLNSMRPSMSDAFLMRHELGSSKRIVGLRSITS